MLFWHLSSPLRPARVAAQPLLALPWARAMLVQDHIGHRSAEISALAHAASQ